MRTAIIFPELLNTSPVDLRASMTDPILGGPVDFDEMGAPLAYAASASETANFATVVGPVVGGVAVTMGITADLPTKLPAPPPLPSQPAIDTWYALAQSSITQDVTVTSAGPGGFFQYVLVFSGGRPTVSEVVDLSIADVLTGGNLIDLPDSNDRVEAGDGADTVDGGVGSDTLFGGAGKDKLDGGAGSDSLFGGGGNDRLKGDAGADWLVGGKGRDTLLGGNQSDTLNGGEGVDLLKGGGGADILRGGGSAGRETLDGGSGQDRIYGDAGNALMIGGRGADTFVLDLAAGTAKAGTNTIKDFNLNQDTLLLQAMVDGSSPSIEDLLTNATTFGSSGATVDLGDITLVLRGVEAGDLTDLIAATSYDPI